MRVAIRDELLHTHKVHFVNIAFAIADQASPFGSRSCSRCPSFRPVTQLTPHAGHCFIGSRDPHLHRRSRVAAPCQLRSGERACRVVEGSFAVSRSGKKTGYGLLGYHCLAYAGEVFRIEREGLIGKLNRALVFRDRPSSGFPASRNRFPMYSLASETELA